MGEDKLIELAGLLTRIQEQERAALGAAARLKIRKLEIIAEMRRLFREDITLAAVAPPSPNQEPIPFKECPPAFLPPESLSSPTKSNLRNQIVSYLAALNYVATTEEIAKATGLTSKDDKPKLFTALSRLKKDGFIERVRRGKWKAARKPHLVADEDLRENREGEEDIDF